MTFYELEKKCKQRRLKNFLYKILFFLSIICIILLALYLYEILNMKANNVHKKIIQKQIKQKKIIKKQFPKKEIKKNVKKQPIKENNEVLMPIIPNIELKVEVNKSRFYQKPMIKKNKKVKKTSSTIKKSIEGNNAIEIEKLPSYKESIRIAEKYLNEKKYDLALKWAKNANIRNKISPESWIISAKALFYSGKKKKAIKILKVYLNYYKNKEVEDLVKEFKNEKNN